MSAYFKPGTPGLNVAVLQATPEREIIVIDRVIRPGEAPQTDPVYWGNDELGTLTPAETATVETLLPLAVRKTASKSAPAPDAPATAARTLLWGAGAAGLMIGLALWFFVEVLLEPLTV